ncbi:hypothetical protein CRE_23575 [Caenorhabditis remanei]|uniref:MAM domain-containing protein n=1 Tax=Caenorhabditis remanei TaxID=31234 RepID=E3MVV9_CAERE|nr:hypothetical protein CRE_23575 [Caenorhabditis remanei]
MMTPPFKLMFLQFFYILTRIFSGILCLELCTFDDGTCEWDIKPPWNVVSLAILPRHQQPGFLITSKTPDVITSEGPFLLAQGKFASIPTSRVTSQKLSKSDHMRILAYRYQRRGMATLRILLKNQTDEVLLDTISPNELQRNKWFRRSVIFPPIEEDDQTSVVFECDNIQTAEDVIAVDDIDVATPANVMWAGQDSKFFDEEDIRRREIRRSSKLSKVCTPISCHFRSTICSWQSSNIQLLPNKIVNEASGESILTSSAVRLPVDESSFIQLQMFDSAGSISSLSFRNIGSMIEKTIWTEDSTSKTEQNSQNGWNRILIPLDSVPKGIPIVLILKSITGSNDFVAFSSIDLVDQNSKTITCDQVTSPVQPHSGQFVRLTALQNLKMSPIESILYQPPISTTTPFFPIPPPSISFNMDEKVSRSPVAVLPISPAHVSARGIPIVPVSTFSNPLIPLSIPKFPFHF